MTSAYSGRLELTWTNKDKTLLAHEDQRYEWVNPADYRVSEVRLLHDVEAVGDTASESERTRDNLLIRGDALHVLNALTSIPEFAKEYVGKVKLVYIDPPFNTRQAFAHYDDALEHSVWLTMMRDRLTQIRELLSLDGSVWVHLDDTEVHRCRVVLDEVMGVSNFVATVMWQKADNTRSNNKGFSTSHDTILIYQKSDAWSANWMRRSAALDVKYTSPDGDSDRWFDGPTTVRGDQKHHEYIHAIQHPITGELLYPSKGRHWAKSRDWILSQMAEYAPYELRDISDVAKRAEIAGVSNSRIKSSVDAVMLSVPLATAAKSAQARYREGNWPDIVLRSGGEGGIGFKLRIPKGGSVPTTWWTHEEVGSNRSAKSEIKALFPGEHAYETPKPERLLQRIIHIATNPGDIVLDCYAGSGTTAAVAHKMGRRWVTSEWSAETVSRYTLPRLRKVVQNQDPGGITSTRVPTGEELPEGVAPGAARDAAKTISALTNAGLLEKFDEEPLQQLVRELQQIDRTRTEVLWSGGGGFRVLEVGASMFDVIDGRVYIADWAVNHALGEAVAAQFGYAYEVDGPFSGAKGNTRLAVVDGLVNDGVVRLLVDVLPDSQKLLVCGTAIDPECRSILRELRPGSTMKKIPSAILDDYRLRRRDRLALSSVLDWTQASKLIDRDIKEAESEIVSGAKK